jgi:membrane-bound lytic murein transglycosylase D
MKILKGNSIVFIIALSVLVLLLFPAVSHAQVTNLPVDSFVTKRDTVVEVDTIAIEQVKLDTLVRIDSILEADSILAALLINSNNTDTMIAKRLAKIENVMPLIYNKNVKGFIDYFTTGKNKNYLLTMERRKNIYFPIFEAALKRWGLPDELKYLPIVESGLNPMAISVAGASGPWQFMPSAGREYGLIVTDYIDERLDIYKSTEAACRFFTWLHKYFGNWDLCLASYNCGPGTVKRAMRQSGRNTFWSIYQYLPRETRSYVPQFVAVTYGMNYLKEYNIVADSLLYPMETDTILLHQFVNIHILCEKLNICYEDFVKLNPAIRTNILPDNVNYPIRLPKEKKLDFLLNQHEITECINVITDPIEVATNDRRRSSTSGAVAYRQKIVHTVKTGEVVGKIAGKYGVSVSQIKSWNGLKSSTIRRGQKLVIYKMKYSKTAPSIAAKKNVNPAGTRSNTNSEATMSKAAPKYHYVQPGDTLWTISKKYGGLSIEKIRQLNNLNGNIIKVGQKLLLS